MISLHFYRINTEWLQRAGEETAKESTCNYVEVICSTGASTQPLLVFTELGCFDKTGGKPQVTNEYGGLGGGKKTFAMTLVLSICYIFFLLLCQTIPIMTMLPVVSESCKNREELFILTYDED